MSARNNNGNRSRKARGGLVRAIKSMEIPKPTPSTDLQLAEHKLLSFAVTAAANTTITYQNLLDTILVATTATAGSDVFQAVRINWVAVWGMPAIGGVPSTVAVEYSGAVAGSQGDQRIVADTSMGVQPAYVKVKPPRTSLASMYQPSSVAAAFNVRAVAGSVVEVSLNFKGQYTANTAAQNALVAATAGAFYLRGLDGLATATSNYPPAFTQLQI
jgi:hypothetical protein